MTLDRDVAEHGIGRVGEVLAARLGVAPGDDRSGSYRAWDLAMRAIGAERRRRVVVVILDGVERLDAGLIPGITSYFWAHAASEESSQKAPVSLLPLFLFLVDYRGRDRRGRRRLRHRPARGDDAQHRPVTGDRAVQSRRSRLVGE